MFGTAFRRRSRWSRSTVRRRGAGAPLVRESEHRRTRSAARDQSRSRTGSRCNAPCKTANGRKCLRSRRFETFSIITKMSEAASNNRRPRLLWTLLGAMVLVGLLPLLVSHYVLIGINRDSLETLEKKYSSRSAVGIATDVQNLLTNNSQQLSKIAGSIRVMRKALPAGTDPFTYAAQSGWITDYISADSDVLALRVLNTEGQGAEAKPAGLDAPIVQELNLAVEAALKGQPYIGTFQTVTLLNQPAVILAVPVIDDGKIIGVIEALVSLRRVADRIQEEGKGDVQAFVVDRNGRVLI